MTPLPESAGRYRVPPPPGLAPVLLLAALLSLLGPDPVLALVGLASLGGVTWLLWRPGEAPILLFLVVYQWLQVNAKTVHGYLLGVGVEALPSYGGDLALAILLGNAALVVLALGLRWGAGFWRPAAALAARQQVGGVPMRVWLQLYGIGWAISLIATAMAWVVPGLTQPLLALAALRWATFFTLTFAAFSRRRYWGPWWLMFGAEFLLSVGGFFAGFNTAIFYALFGLTAALYPFTMRRVLPLLALLALLGFSALAWTAVKGEYRGFVSGGEANQGVVVGRSERLAKLGGLVTSLEPGTLADTLDKLAERLAYVDFFARVMLVVPDYKPHAQGAIWGDALLRAFTPRLLFPGKSAVHDSVRTNEYTGLGVATHEQGTSISVGYTAESYIDFGVPLMFLPILALGWGLGRFYRWLHTSPRSLGIWGMALAAVALFPAAAFETSATKMLVALAVSMLAAWAIVRFALPVLLPWLMARYLRRQGLRTPQGLGSGLGR